MSLFSKLIRNVKRFSDRKSLAVVHDDDLKSLLSELGALHDIEAGTAVCGHCSSKISLDNLAGWVKLGPRLVLFCDDKDCLVRVSALSSKGNEVNEQDG